MQTHCIDYHCRCTCRNTFAIQIQAQERERIQKGEQEEIWGDWSSCCWQRSILLSQEDLNHPHINTFGLEGFIQDIFISCIFFLFNHTLCYLSPLSSHFLSVLLSLSTATDLLSTLLYFYVIFLFGVSVIAESHQMRWSAWRRHSLALAPFQAEQRQSVDSSRIKLCLRLKL